MKITDWIAALRDPANRQTRSALMEMNGAMCCLGLALKIAGVEHHKLESEGCYYFGGESSMPNDGQCEIIGIERLLAQGLAAVNDGGAAFADIADFLETGNEQPLLRFTDGDTQSHLIEALRAYTPPQ